MIEVDVIVADSRWSSAWPDPAPLATQAVEAVLALVRPAGQGNGLDIALSLDSDAGIRDLNRAWRGKDQPTNVLSFPAADHGPGGEARHLGDIVLAYETVVREAQSESKSPVHHAAHLVVHGTLHLLGYDHEGDAEGDAMEALEIQALARLGIADPYHDRVPGTVARGARPAS